ncbi:hypothetical protein [Modestobacter roseus]|uniref:Uncharacterized protein n=1 Tax=Modestobacter roseus TaxID=1181884 RepID=A0A562IUT8_9ACTN|nr:hypothetical protein [Modestobacter roseus]MQA33010.1 hypothetical protein [Modestobacter roseus]TWH74533.1 hypothetical protein JD78_03073 [Modestobacter roseus]
MKHRAPTPVTTRRRIGVVLTASALMISCGVAVAAWTNSGTGAANARATTAGALVVTAGTPVGTLYPKPAGGYSSTTIGAVYTTVANPNPYPVRVLTATFGTVVITPLPGQTCAAGSVVPSTAGPMTLGAPVDLPANAPATAVTVPGAIEMVATAEDGCQGASFTVPVTLTGASS